MRHVISTLFAATFAACLATTTAPALAQFSQQDSQSTGAAPLFVLPNFEGDAREADCHYNTLHQYPHPPWDTHRRLLYSYSVQKHQFAAHGFPPPPYSMYDYVGGCMTPGPGGPVPSAVPGNPIFVSTGTGVTVGTGSHPNIHGSVSGTVMNPQGNMLNTSVPGLVGGY